MTKSRAYSERVSTVCFLAFVAIVAVCAMCQCSAAKPAQDAATCSPAADAWHQVELARVCGRRETSECPEAPAIRARYLEMEASECSGKH